MSVEFELKYLDSPTGVAIPLQPNQPVTLGRGKVGNLIIDDRRISRNHCEISLIAGQIFIQSMHTNPCFITKTSEKKRQLIHKNESIRLEIGDKFSLLPDSHSFLVCQHSNGTIASGASNNANVSLDETLPTTSSSTPAKRKLPAWMAQLGGGGGSPTKQSQIQNNDDDSALLSTQPYNFDQSQSDNLQPCTCTCVKDEAVDNPIVKTSPQKADQPSGILSRQVTSQTPSNDNNATGSNNNNNRPLSTSSASSSGGQKQRVRCAYGRSCYRKNPVHFAQFCHPGDADYAQASDNSADAASMSSSSSVAEAPPCRYGAQCYRKNSQHRLEYSHPEPSTSTAPPQTRRGPRQPVPALPDEDEEEEEEQESGDADYQPSDSEIEEAEEQQNDDDTNKTSSTDLIAQSDNENDD